MRQIDDSHHPENQRQSIRDKRKSTDRIKNLNAEYYDCIHEVFRIRSIGQQQSIELPVFGAGINRVFEARGKFRQNGKKHFGLKPKCLSVNVLHDAGSATAQLPPPSNHKVISY